MKVSVKILFDRNVVRGPTKDVEYLLNGEIIVTARMLRHVYNIKNLNNEICLLQTSGRYRWVDNWLLSYTKWATGEPKNNLACVYIDTDGDWKTTVCSNKYYSLCKRSTGISFNILQAINIQIILQIIYFSKFNFVYYFYFVIKF